MKDFYPYSDNSSGPFRDAAMVLLLLLSLPLLPFFWLVYGLRRQYSLAVRGFWVAGKGRDNIEYQEKRDGKIERLTIYGEMMASGPHVVYVPDEQSWQQDVPRWAQHRREEIVGRIKLILGSRKYEYVT